MKHDRRKYLFLRFILYIVLVYFTFIPLFINEVIDERVFFTTILLLISPLFLEYLKGLATFNNLTKIVRKLGLIITGTYAGICGFALMGGLSIQLSNRGIATSIKFLIGPEIPVSFMWTLGILLLALTFFDWIFTLSNKELEHYKLQDKVNEMIQNGMKKINRKDAVELKMEELAKVLDIERTGK